MRFACTPPTARATGVGLVGTVAKSQVLVNGAPRVTRWMYSIAQVMLHGCRSICEWVRAATTRVARVQAQPARLGSEVAIELHECTSGGDIDTGRRRG